MAPQAPIKNRPQIERGQVRVALADFSVSAHVDGVSKIRTVKKGEKIIIGQLSASTRWGYVHVFNCSGQKMTAWVTDINAWTELL